MWKRDRTERVDIEEVLKSTPVSVPAAAPKPIEPVVTVAAPPPAATTASAPAPAPSSTPVSMQAPAQKACVLGSTLRIKGDLVADEDLVIEGQVDGSVLHTRSLTIGSPGHVRGDIRARRVIIEGKVSGNVYALESVTLRAGATLQGDVYARSVSIETGACISGRVDMDNAPAVPKVDTSGLTVGDLQARDLSVAEVGELLANSPGGEG